MPKETPWTNRLKEVQKTWFSPCLNYRRSIRDLIVKLLKPHDLLLDVGCGTGILKDHLPPESFYVGIDYTGEFLDFLSQKKPLGLVLGDVNLIPFQDNIFKIVNETGVLFHCSQWKNVIIEMVRVSQKYVISTTRISEETKIIGLNPFRIVFSEKDVITEFKKHGSVTFEKVKDMEGQLTLGMTLVEKKL